PYGRAGLGECCWRGRMRRGRNHVLGLNMDDLWDAVVVGAGPAGSVSAALLAQRGWRVLLLEKSPWPRDKACGGCVNAAAVRMLREAGLGGVLSGAAAMTKMMVQAGIRALHVPLPAGVAEQRRKLDA